MKIKTLAIVAIAAAFGNVSYSAVASDVDLEMYKVARNPGVVELLKATGAIPVYVQERQDHYLAFSSECSSRVRVEYRTPGVMTFVLSHYACGAYAENRTDSLGSGKWICTPAGAGKKSTCFRRKN